MIRPRSLRSKVAYNKLPIARQRCAIQFNHTPIPIGPNCVEQVAFIVEHKLHICTIRAHASKATPFHANPKETHSLNLSRNSGLGVCDLDTELLRACNNIDSLS